MIWPLLGSAAAGHLEFRQEERCSRLFSAVLARLKVFRTVECTLETIMWPFKTVLHLSLLNGPLGLMAQRGPKSQWETSQSHGL